MKPATLAAPAPPVWQPLATGALACLALLALFQSTAGEIVAIWNRSETFAHGWLVVPVSLGLLWWCRARLLAQPFRPAWWALPLFALAAAGWAAGELASVAVVEQFGLLAMLWALLLGCWGWAACRAVAFPLAFLAFAVPSGEFLMPILMRHTADFTVAALQATGIPVWREGLSFMIPSGQWSVVEACSGIRYLIASLMVGVFFAYLNYRSLARRAAFVALALVVPLVANWLRAYFIVLLGHYSDNQLAVGADHLIYGWLFFGVVVFLMLALGNAWREPVPRPVAPAQRGGIAPAASLLAALLALGLAGVAAALPARIYAQPQPVALRLAPPAAAPGWVLVPDAVPAWLPIYTGARARSTTRYARGAASLTLDLAYYAAQRPGHELVQWDNRPLAGEQTRWRIVGEGVGTLAGQPVRTLQLRGTGLQVQAWSWLWLGGERVSVSEREAKLALLGQRLSGAPDAGAAIWLIAEHPGGEGDAQALAEEFLQAHSAGLLHLLQHAAGEGGR